MHKINNLLNSYLKKDLPDIRPGDTVKVYQKIKEKDKERVQTFEGLVLARKHGKEMGATITVRKIISGVGVEKIFPLHSPVIEKIEILRRSKVRRAKLYYLRTAKGKRARLKRKEFAEVMPPSDAPDSAEAMANKEALESKEENLKNLEKSKK